MVAAITPAGATVGLSILLCRRAPQAHQRPDSPTGAMPAPGSLAASQVFSPSTVSMGGVLWHGVFLSPVIPAGTPADSLHRPWTQHQRKGACLSGRARVVAAVRYRGDHDNLHICMPSLCRRSALIDIALNMRSRIHCVWAAPSMRRQAILHPHSET